MNILTTTSRLFALKINIIIPRKQVADFFGPDKRYFCQVGISKAALTLFLTSFSTANGKIRDIANKH